jgi:hypothetical protein
MGRRYRSPGPNGSVPAATGSPADVPQTLEGMTWDPTTGTPVTLGELHSRSAIEERPR